MTTPDTTPGEFHGRNWKTSTLGFMQYLLVSTGWLYGSAIVIGKTFGPGLAYIWPFALLVIFGGYALILVYAATRKYRVFAALGTLFAPGCWLIAYVTLHIMPIPSFFYPVVFSEHELPHVGAKFERPNPNLKIIYLPTPAHCSHGPCREILFETPYSVMNPTSKGDWIIYRIGSGDICVTPENLGRTLNLVLENVLDRCIVSEKVDSRPPAIYFQRHWSKFAEENSLVAATGWKVSEGTHIDQRELGKRIWGHSIPFFILRVKRDVGPSATRIEILNEVLGLDLDGVVDMGEPADSAEILEFLKPYLFHSKNHIRYKATKKLKEISSFRQSDVPTREEILIELAETFRDMIQSGDIGQINLALAASSALNYELFEYLRKDLTELALNPMRDGVHYAKLVKLLSWPDKSPETYTSDTRLAAASLLTNGDSTSKIQDRLGFVLMASGGTENRAEAFDALMNLPSPRHEEVVIHLELRAAAIVKYDYFPGWSTEEVDRLLERARTFDTPTLIRYVLSFREAIYLSQRRDVLAELLKARYEKSDDAVERAELEKTAERFGREL